MPNEPRLGQSRKPRWDVVKEHHDVDDDVNFPVIQINVPELFTFLQSNCQ